jgi:hypothetical protein
MNCFYTLYSLLLLFLVATASNQISTLVLTDSVNIQQTHSKFFHAMKGRGHTITFKLADEVINVYDNKKKKLLYENIIVIAPEAEDLLGSLDTDPITNFVLKGGNLMVTASSTETSFLIHELSTKCGVTLSDSTITGSSDDQVMYSNLEQPNGTKTSVHKNWFGIKKDWKILFHGVTLSSASSTRLKDTIRNHGNDLRLSKSYYSPILQASDDDSTATRDLVVAVEARNGVRVVVSGSMDLCSDDYFAHEIENNNDAFCNAISSWAFHEVGRLRAQLNIQRKENAEPMNAELQYLKKFWSAGVSHHLHTYKSNEVLQVSVKLEEGIVGGGDNSNIHWVAHKISMSNKIIVNLISFGKIISTFSLENEGNDVYTGSIQVPSKNGVYILQVLYENPGYSVVEKRMEIVVAPTVGSLFTSNIRILATWLALGIGCLVTVSVVLPLSIMK